MRNMLQQEAIDEMDLFLALTNDDEDNIMGASLAKRMGCKRVVALINRRAYAELVQGGPIDIALSPAQVSIGTLLTYVRHGDVAQVHSLRRGAAEALEIVAHGDQKTSKVVGRRIGELPEIRWRIHRCDRPRSRQEPGSRLPRSGQAEAEGAGADRPQGRLGGDG
jgi:trk system potassium uptake protein TrkA